MLHYRGSNIYSIMISMILCGLSNISIFIHKQHVVKERLTTSEVSNIMLVKIRVRISKNITLFKNWKINSGIIFEVFIVTALMYAPLLQSVFETGPLGWQEWLFLICIPIPVFLIEELRKFAVRRHRHGAAAV